VISVTNPGPLRALVCSDFSRYAKAERKRPRRSRLSLWSCQRSAHFAASENHSHDSETISLARRVPIHNSFVDKSDGIFGKDSLGW
jgi:hypothetical protein